MNANKQKRHKIPKTVLFQVKIVIHKLL